MKRVILICPDKRPGLDVLWTDQPLAAAPLLGRPLIAAALDGLARQGVQEVLVLATDRPAETRCVTGHGEAFGLRVDVRPETEELTPETAATRHAGFGADSILTLDELPQAPGIRLLDDLSTWHAAHAPLLPLLVPAQVGTRQILPGVWVGLKAKVEPGAELHAPCWIGADTLVRRGARIGPDVYIGQDCLIDTDAEIAASTVAPLTYVGSLTNLQESFASGAMLASWRTGSVTRLRDSFLLSALEPPRPPASTRTARGLAALALVLTAPAALLAAIVAKSTGRPVTESRETVLATAPGHAMRSVSCQEFTAFRGPWRRWPLLWRIVTGHLSWTGNPPLSPDEAAALDGEFDRLWISVAPGVFTAPEAEGCSAPWDDAARAHAALFASQATAAWRWRILRHGLRSLFFASPALPATGTPQPAAP